MVNNKVLNQLLNYFEILPKHVKYKKKEIVWTELVQQGTKYIFIELI